MTIVDPMQPLRTHKSPKQPQTVPKVRTVPIAKPQVVSSIAIPAPPHAPAKRASEKPLADRPNITPSKTKRYWPKIAVLVLFVVALMLLPEFLSQILLVIYGVLAVFKRYVVGLTFGLAILVLLLSPLFGLVTGSSGNGAVLASYSFGLLLVGFVQLIIEYRRMQRQ